MMRMTVAGHPTCGRARHGTRSKAGLRRAREEDETTGQARWVRSAKGQYNYV